LTCSAARRQGIKDFSIGDGSAAHVKGEFVGGCDIVREMFENGELAQLMATRGVKTAAVPT
jgi:monothiol glutaredoxin